MKRTNIYLGDDQTAALEDAARARGLTRAELVRRLIDKGLDSTGSADLDADLAALNDSFAIASAGDDFPLRGRDDRARHLDRVGRR